MEIVETILTELSKACRLLAHNLLISKYKYEMEKEASTFSEDYLQNQN